MKKYIVYILITLCFVCSVHAEFSLVHQPGMYDELQENGMQKTHTDYQIMYAMPGETVYLYRPERATFVGYVRWYCYDTDRAVPRERVENTWIKDTIKIKAINDYGWFAFDYATDRVTTKDSAYIELKYTMHEGDSVYRIACDQGIYKDYSWNADGKTTEATLSKRIIFEIRPAKWMADSLELCKVTSSNPNDRYLEEHKLIAPVGRQLYVGPNYMYHTKKVALSQYTYNARSNYYYYNRDGVLTSAGSDNKKWKWYINGVLDDKGKIAAGEQGAQFATMSSDVPGTFVYTMKYEYATGCSVNVARFTITYMDVNKVGPDTSIVKPSKNMEMIYEENFNYDYPGTTEFAFWRGIFDADESTYGYYNKNFDETNYTSKRKIRKGNITWSEYAVTNAKLTFGTSDYTYQHVDNTENISDNAKKGYMLYCDGSQQPGQVFNLKIHANLCPGSTMYFSAWLCDVSTDGKDKSAPNMDFVVTGIDVNGKEHALTTFTTGEFGINAVNKVGESGNMERGKWYQIMFPVKFNSGDTYPTYRLRITNKSKSSDGNDFAIDDIRIYVEKPAVIPIQASTSDCIDKAVDSIRAYIRVDYNEIDHDGKPLYYQWREGDKIVHTNYYNIDGPNNTFGKINILSDSAIIQSGVTCSNLFDFDNQFKKTDTAVVRYILEEVAPDSFRYIMYIAMPIEVRINREYTSFVSLSPSTLGDRSGCGTFADMLVAGGTRITINDEITFGDSVVTVCGHRSYTLNIVLTKIIQDETQGELSIDTTHCKADWLIGDSVYVNSHPEIYKYSFDEIEKGLGFYRQHVPSAIQMVNFLKNHGLLVLDTASIVMNPGVSLSYTAFPLAGSAFNDSIEICTTPRFLHINPADSASNMMEVGDSTEVLPKELLSQPRIVRISNAKKNDGSFDLPLYLKGDTTERYVIDSVYIISSTNPNWKRISLNYDHDTLTLIDTVLLSSNNLCSLEAGYDYTFHVAFEGETDEDKCDRGYTYFTLRIIPDVVTWEGGDWNIDANWDYFIPMKETNVILLQNTDYIVSFNDTSYAKYDINYIENQCDSIYFPDGASMYGQELITINGVAFIDVKEYAWKWTLTSIPIKGVVTGDIFISVKESAEPFVVAKINQIVGNTAYDRVTWQVYNKEYDATKDKWKVAANTLVRPIVTGEANMIGIDCETDDVNPIVRLPKQDNMYRYYEKNQHVWMNENESITRDENYGKPSWNGDNNITLKEIYTNIYLFGNPTFGYIDITKLVEDNSDKLTGKYYLEVKGATTIPKKDSLISFNRDVHTDEYHVLLPPYRGILLEGYASSNELIINIDSTKVNPTGRQAPKRYRYTNNDIATDVQNINTNNIYSIYDIMGRKYMNDIKQLPSGIYIVHSGDRIQKILIE